MAAKTELLRYPANHNDGLTLKLRVHFAYKTFL